MNQGVEENFSIGGGFALWLPISVLELISNGISHFRQ
jgi:hypothetical protein